ncbi:MAG: hypothetical protein RQ748_00345 [Elusimicrobiales bacterium]|nr:hypothetical protein [Elusimicrobiales bacterium]
MKKVLFPLLLAVLPFSLYSQQKPASADKVESAVLSAAAEDEDGTVMIDGSEAPAPVQHAPDRDAYGTAGSGESNALPASLGDVKGTFAEAGRNMLVLQADDGTINFVQFVFGRTGTSWKIVGSLPRSLE